MTRSNDASPLQIVMWECLRRVCNVDEHPFLPRPTLAYMERQQPFPRLNLFNPDLLCDHLKQWGPQGWLSQWLAVNFSEAVLGGGTLGRLFARGTVDKQSHRRIISKGASRRPIPGSDVIPRISVANCTVPVPVNPEEDLRSEPTVEDMADDDEKKPIVAFLGPEGSYTHQAALSTFSPSSSTLHPVPLISSVFAAVQQNHAHLGVIPLENSSNGSVVATLDLFADTASNYPDILVCGEAYVAVRHCLLGHKTPVPVQQNVEEREEGREGEDVAKYAHIKTLYSHPQAWGQCNLFLAKYLQAADKQDVSSTSRAAEMAASDTSGTSAALSSIAAAEIFGLDVLAKGVNDKVGNTTRFLVLRNRSIAPTYALLDRTISVTPEEEATTQQCKSLVTFTVEHSNPGALANCLTAFSEHGINLTSINTRPSGVGNWNYVFFVEFKGRRIERGQGQEGEGEDNVEKALGELEKRCKRLRWLGSWENRLEEER
ncbi:chorismate mutase prephenate dehydratase [Pyrenophora seminiperda CCB06]|uniref:Chorismate mutase prephenate dehydratase n=1 Tax=Pyrenophora seminiperda CCB06 TaxID=1302712 RepID=A0A3M7MFB4_9PLEO|nr:chorismate mutase prephenate dehydratase [Pyrenophora seminiperda CCB06]